MVFSGETDRHDITEILLKVVLNAIIPQRHFDLFKKTCMILITQYNTIQYVKHHDPTPTPEEIKEERDNRDNDY